MRIDIATLFPEMCEAVLSTSIRGVSMAGVLPARIASAAVMAS